MLHRSKALMTAALTLAWLGVFEVFSRAPEMAQFQWALATSIIITLLLDGFGYFERFRVRGPFSDYVSLCLISPIPALISKIWIGWSYGFPIIRYSEFLPGVPLVALAIVLLDLVLKHFDNLRLGGRSRALSLVLALSDTERADLRQALQQRSGNWVLNNVSNLSWMLKTGAHPDLIIVSRAELRKSHCSSGLLSAHLRGIPVVQFESFMADLRKRIAATQVDPWTLFAIALPQTPSLRIYAIGKRSLEPIVAIAMLIALMPLLALVTLAIRLTSPGPALFRQKRVGIHGNTFDVIKFRSMRIDAERDGPRWAAELDSRVTPIGRFLRSSHLDELPQLWNIALGQMSFIGPRPERPEFARKLRREIPLFHLRTLVRPGITGWAQLEGGYASSIEQSRIKLEYDLYYIQNASPQLDLIILLRTLLKAIPDFGTQEESREAPPAGTEAPVVAQEKVA